MREIRIVAVVALLIQITRFIKIRAKKVTKQTLLSIIKQLLPLSPSELIKNFDKLEDYGLCVGKAFASEKCPAILKPKINVLISKLYEIKKVFDFKQLIRTKRPAFFTLKDEKNSAIPILQTAHLSMKTTHFIQTLNSVSKISQTSIFISLINRLKDIRLPYITETTFREYFLPDNTTITLLGKYKRQASGKICCEKPIMMGKSKSHMIQKLQKKISKLKIEKTILICGIGISVLFLLKQIYSFYLSQKQTKKNPIENIQQLFVKSRVCLNCHQKISNFILQRCGHLNMCKECKQKLKKCVQCKQTAQEGCELFPC